MRCGAAVRRRVSSATSVSMVSGPHSAATSANARRVALSTGGPAASASLPVCLSIRLRRIRANASSVSIGLSSLVVAWFLGAPAVQGEPQPREGLLITWRIRCPRGPRRAGAGAARGGSSHRQQLEGAGLQLGDRAGDGAGGAQGGVLGGGVVVDVLGDGLEAGPPGALDRGLGVSVADEVAQRRGALLVVVLRGFGGVVGQGPQVGDDLLELAHGQRFVEHPLGLG